MRAKPESAATTGRKKKVQGKPRSNATQIRQPQIAASVDIAKDWGHGKSTFETGEELLNRILIERRKNWQGRGQYKEPDAADTTDLPVVPDRWTWASVAQLSFLDVGFAFKSAEFVKSGIRLLRGENLEPGRMRWEDTRYWPESNLEPFRQLLIREGEIVLAMDRPLVSSGLKIARARADDLPCLLVQRMARFRPIYAAMTSYLFLALNTQSFIKHLVGNQTGTQLPHISGDGIQSFPVALPPPAEQTQIVAELEKQFTRLEAGVAALRRVQANLKRYRAAVLKAACEGRLVPTEAELAKNGKRKGKFETGEELLARILKERRKNWRGRGEYRDPVAADTANLPKIPAGWKYASIETLGFVQLGRQRAPKHHNGANMRPYLRVANVYEDRIDISDVKEMNFTPDEFEVFRLETNDILLNEGQSLELVGRPAVYRGELPGVCFTNTLVRFRPCPSLDVKFALSVFRAYMHSGRFQKIANWTTNIAHLGADRFAKLAFPLPPLAEQTRIVAEVERRLSVVEELEAVVAANLQRATRLRQAILQKAFTGELC